MKTLFYRTFFLIPGFILASIMSGCDTGEGFGRDLQDAGEAIEDAAEDAQEE